MTTQLNPAPSRAPAPRPATSSGWFRAFWRWHFYAAFLVAPVLLILAVTGLIYLFRFQLEPLINADLMKISAPSANSIQQPYANQLAAVERSYPGRDRRLDDRARGRRTAAPCSRSRCPTSRRATSSSIRTAPRCSARSTPTPRCPAMPSGSTAS